MAKSRQRKWKITMNEMNMERSTRKTFEGEMKGKDQDGKGRTI